MIEALRKYLDDFEFPEEQKAVFITAMKKLLDITEAEDALGFHIQEYKQSNLDWEKLVRDATEYAAKADIHEYTSKFLFYTALIPYSFHFYEEKGLGYNEWYDSMIDFKWKVAECCKCYGIAGVFTDWFKMFFTAERIAFGRLQFNLISSNFDYNSEHFNVKTGDSLVTIHIPSDTRSEFNRENREAAYKRAAAYFSKILGTKEVIFTCGTWLLHPAHRDILPEGSNIRDFAKDFEMDEKSFAPDGGKNLWRFFYVMDYNGDPDSLPETTTLMRIYKKFLKEGGVLGTCRGYRKETVV